MSAAQFVPYAPPIITDLPTQLAVFPRHDPSISVFGMLAASLRRSSRRQPETHPNLDPEQPAPEPEIEIDEDNEDDLWGGLEDEFTTGLVCDEHEEALPELGDFWLEREEGEE